VSSNAAASRASAISIVLVFIRFMGWLQQHSDVSGIPICRDRATCAAQNEALQVIDSIGFFKNQPALSVEERNKWVISPESGGAFHPIHPNGG
jgi:hypothetical protein